MVSLKTSKKERKKDSNERKEGGGTEVRIDYKSN